MKYIYSVLTCCFIGFFSSSVFAQTDSIDISISMDGAQSGTPSPGTGSELGSGVNGCYYVNSTNTLYIKIQYSGLLSNTTAAHIHGPGKAGVNAGVVQGLTGFVTGAASGTYTASFVLSATNETRLFDTSLYINIHTGTYPGGEIRGQLINTESYLPVELTSFTAVVKGSGVELAWKTATEVNNHGFEVERKEVRDSGFESSEQNSIPKPQTINQEWLRVGFVDGNGTSNVAHEYVYTDRDISAGNYSYRLKQIDRDGQFEYSKSIEVVMSQIPQTYALMQNFPNPFNPTTVISYQLSEKSSTTLIVYDVLGREAATLVNGVKEAGVYSVRFNASHLSGGVYFYVLNTRNFRETKKMLLTK